MILTPTRLHHIPHALTHTYRGKRGSPARPRRGLGRASGGFWEHQSSQQQALLPRSFASSPSSCLVLVPLRYFPLARAGLSHRSSVYIASRGRRRSQKGDSALSLFLVPCAFCTAAAMKPRLITWSSFQRSACHTFALYLVLVDRLAICWGHTLNASARSEGWGSSMVTAVDWTSRHLRKRYRGWACRGRWSGRRSKVGWPWGVYLYVCWGKGGRGNE